MKMSIIYTITSLICLLSTIGAQAEILNSKNINGALWVTVKNSGYGYFPYRTTDYYQIETLERNLEDKVGNKNLAEIKEVCSRPKIEGSDKPYCYSEEVPGSHSTAKRVCEVKTYFSCQ